MMSYYTDFVLGGMLNGHWTAVPRVLTFLHDQAHCNMVAIRPIASQGTCAL